VIAVRISADGRSGLSIGRDGTLRSWTLPGRSHHAPYQFSRPRLHNELNDIDAQADALLDAAREAIADNRHEQALQLISRARTLPGQEYAPRVRATWRVAGEITRWTGPRAPRQESALNTFTTHSAIALCAVQPIAALGGDDIQLWDLETGSLLRSINGHPSMVEAVAFSPDGSLLYSATRDGEISQWSVTSGERLRRLEGRRTAGAHATAFTDDGSIALVGGSDNRVVLWNLANAERLAVLGAHSSRVTSAWISPHGEVGATTGGDGLVRIWDLRSRQCQHTLRGHTSSTGSVCLSGDLRTALSSGNDDRALRLWDLETGECVRVFQAMTESANTVRLTPNDAFALSAGKDGKIRIWDVGTGRCTKVLDGPRSEASNLAISPNGWRAASIGNDRTLRVWDLDWDLSTN
jgi:WD40 repeat protein